jgi:hypothetical protein
MSVVRPRRSDSLSKDAAIEELERRKPLNASVSDDKADADTEDGHAFATEEKRLLRRIDLRLIPWLSVLYLFSFLDRTSIGQVVRTIASSFPV